MEGEVRISTPESVHIAFEIAGIGSRFVAILLDTFIQMVLLLILLISLIGAGVSLERAAGALLSWYTALLIIMAFVIFMGYFIFFEMILSGRTPGKAVMKIRVMQSNGQPVSFMGSMLRNIFRLADFFPGFYGVGVVMMFISPDSRRIGDYLGGTVVVRDYTAKAPLFVSTAESEENAAVNLYPLEREEYRLLKDFMARRQELLPSKRAQIADELAARFWNKFFVPEEEREAPEDFLTALLKSNSR